MWFMRLSRLKPVPLACGLAVSISLAVSWILYINHLVGTATIPGDDQPWIERARTEAYGFCYNGCNACLDFGKIEDACRITATVQLPGVICDASRMWFWADRYPAECLQAVGGIYREEGLEWKGFKLRFLYILALITAPAGYFTYQAAVWLVKWSETWPQRGPRYRHSDGPRDSATTPLLRAATVSTTLVSMLLFSNPVHGYAYANWHAAHNQPSVSTVDPTLFANIHGWLSNCYTEAYACGEKCESGDADSTTTPCTTHWCDRERADASPGDFVRRAAELVTRCGFKMVDIVPGVVDRRIANPRIEGQLWVKISANRFNGSEGVDKQVLCLGEIVPWPGREKARARGIWSGFRLLL